MHQFFTLNRCLASIAYYLKKLHPSTSMALIQCRIFSFKHINLVCKLKIEKATHTLHAKKVIII